MSQESQIGSVGTIALSSGSFSDMRQSNPGQGFMHTVFGKYALLYRWVFAAIVLEGCIAGALAAFYSSGTPLVVSTVMLSAWTLPFLLWLGSIAVVLPIRRVDRPTATLLRLVRLRKIWFMRAGLLMLASGIFGMFFGMVKSGIPLVVPFYADGLFAAIDRALLGQDAWRFSDHYLGDLVTVVLDRIYLLWFPAMFCLFAFLLSTRDDRLQARGLFVFFVSWVVLGTILAFAGASVGPILYDQFYHHDTFRDLLNKLDRVDRKHHLDVGLVVKYLSDSNEVPKLGGGIAAMPSMHVAVAYLGCLVCNQRGGAVLSVVSWLFFFAILLGSIDLGWHYLVDGIVSVAGVWLLWRLAGTLIERIDAQASVRLDGEQPV